MNQFLIVPPVGRRQSWDVHGFDAFNRWIGTWGCIGKDVAQLVAKRLRKGQDPGWAGRDSRALKGGAMATPCKNGAEYIVLKRKSKRSSSEDHAFACGDHLGELVAGAMDGSPNGRVTVKWVPEPGDQPCEKGVE